MKKQIYLRAFIVLFLLIGIGGITPVNGQQAATRTITNLDGTTIEVPAEVKRVACLYGPSYEKVVLLEAEDKIVLRSEFHSTLWPWSNKIYKRLQEVSVVKSTYNDPNLEELLNSQLDVVFFWDYPKPVKKMQEVGIPVVYPTDVVGQTVEDSKDMLNVYAEALGEEEQKIAQKYCAYFDEKLKMVTEITSTIPTEERPTVYFAVRKPLQTAGKYSKIPELVDLAGGICVHRGLTEGFGTDIVMEQLLEWDPEIIILDHCGSKTLGSAPAEQILAKMVEDDRFAHIRAVEQKRVHISPTGVFFWDAGQQVILQLMWMAKTLHPEKFTQLDITQELKTFYHEFFHYDLTDEEARRILLHLPPEDL